MVKLISLFSHLKSIRALVIGDFFLDTYTFGSIKRISPEAPVPVLNVVKEESKAGGAGNVVLNLVSLGASVIAMGRIGDDRAGSGLLQNLKEEGVDVSGMLFQDNYETPVKNRIIAEAQQIVRIDHEKVTPLNAYIEEQFITLAASILDTVDVVAISDYLKGMLSPRLLKEIIKLARAKNVPVVVDPKGDDFAKYNGATIIKPNLKEAYTAAKLPDSYDLNLAAKKIFGLCELDKLLITRSEKGMSLFFEEGNARLDFPVESKQVKDVTGAGDTALAMVCFAVANKMELKHGVHLANIASGIAIERIGCARVSLKDVAERVKELDIRNKVFEEKHLYGLEQILKGESLMILGVHSEDGMTTSLFRSIRLLVQSNPARKLLVYLRDFEPDEEFVALLSSLSEVCYIVLKSESLRHLCREILPEEVYVMEGDQLKQLDSPQVFFTEMLSV